MSHKNRPAKPLYLAPPSLTSDSDASVSAASETAPITPTNRSFPEDAQDPSLATAVTSAASENVIAARARARSDAAAMSAHRPLSYASKPGVDHPDDSSPLSSIVGGPMSWRRNLAPDKESPAAARRVRLSSSAAEGDQASSNKPQPGSTMHLEQARSVLDASLAQHSTGRNLTPSSRSFVSSDASSPISPFGQPGRMRAASLALPATAHSHDFSSHGAPHLVRSNQLGPSSATVGAGASLSPLRQSLLSRTYSPGQGSVSEDSSPRRLSGGASIFDPAPPSEAPQPFIAHSPGLDASQAHDFDSSFQTMPSLASDSSLGSSGFIETPDTTAQTAFVSKSPEGMRQPSGFDSPWFRHRQETLSSRGAPETPSPKAFSFPRSAEEAQQLGEQGMSERGAGSNTAVRPVSADSNRPKAFSIAGSRPPRIRLAPSDEQEQDIFGPIAAPSPHSRASLTPTAGDELSELAKLNNASVLLYQDAGTGSQSSPATRAPSANSLLRRQTIGAFDASQSRPVSAHLLEPSPQHSPMPVIRSPLGGPPLVSQTDRSDPIQPEHSEGKGQEPPQGECRRGLIIFPASESVDMDTIGAALEVDSYKPRSPSQIQPTSQSVGSACELCGAFADKLTVLKPCGHRACAACCCSGLNQVSATPPRPHLCAACGLGVDDISLPQSRLRYSSLLSKARFITPGSFADIENKAPLDGDGEDIPELDLIDLHIVDPASKPTSPLAPKPTGLRPNSAEAARASAETVIVRIDNIPWTAGLVEILAWIPDHDEILPDPAAVAHPIHVPIELTSGKTGNSGFVECRDRAAAHKLIRHRNNSRLCGRPVNTLMASREELLSEIFPSRALSRSFDPHECTFFTPRELAELMTLLKSGSPQLKGPLKVVEYATSMIRLVPRELEHGQRDLLFERTIEIVRLCIAAIGDIRGLRASLDRLLLQVGLCGAFTVAQKLRIFDDARHTLETVRLYSEAVDKLIEQHHRHEAHAPPAHPATSPALPDAALKSLLHTARSEQNRPRAHTTIGAGLHARQDIPMEIAQEHLQGLSEPSTRQELRSLPTPETPPQQHFFSSRLSPIPASHLSTPQLPQLTANFPTPGFGSPNLYAPFGAFTPSPYAPYLPTPSPWQATAGPGLSSAALAPELAAYQSYAPHFSAFQGHGQQPELASGLPSTLGLSMAASLAQSPWFGNPSLSPPQPMQQPLPSSSTQPQYQQQPDAGEFRALVHAVATSLISQQGHQAQQSFQQAQPPQ